jgi:hypothetical protein
MALFILAAFASALIYAVGKDIMAFPFFCFKKLATPSQRVHKKNLSFPLTARAKQTSLNHNDHVAATPAQEVLFGLPISKWNGEGSVVLSSSIYSSPGSSPLLGHTMFHSRNTSHHLHPSATGIVIHSAYTAPALDVNWYSVWTTPTSFTSPVRS